MRSKHSDADAIDDFGTGYSSLAYLRQFSVDAVKIESLVHLGDRLLQRVRCADSHARAAGPDLGLETVGEGIEEWSQLRHLQRERCDSGQGFLLGRPASAKRSTNCCH